MKKGGNIRCRRTIRAKGKRLPWRPGVVLITVELPEQSFNEIADIAFNKGVSFGHVVRQWLEIVRERQD